MLFLSFDFKNSLNETEWTQAKQPYIQYLNTLSIYIPGAHSNSSCSGVEAAYLRYSTEMWILTGRCEVLLKLASPWLSMWRVSALRALVRLNTAREVDNGYLQTNQRTEALSSVLKLCVLLKTRYVHRGKTCATSKLEIIFDSTELCCMRLDKCPCVWRRISQQILWALEFVYALHRQREGVWWTLAVLQSVCNDCSASCCTCTRAERPLRALTRHHSSYRWTTRTPGILKATQLRLLQFFRNNKFRSLNN